MDQKSKEFVKLGNAIKKNEDFKNHYNLLLNEWLKKKAKFDVQLFSEDCENEFEELSSIMANNNMLLDLRIAMFCSKYFLIKRLYIDHNPTLDEIMNISHPSIALKRLLTEPYKFSDCEYWTYLRKIYLIARSNIQLIPILKLHFKSNRGSKECLMTNIERKFLESLPEFIEIYRGMTKKESRNKNYGISWTLNKVIAESFASPGWDLQFFTEEKVVIALTIPKKEVIAYINEIDEEEIIWVCD